MLTSPPSRRPRASLTRRMPSALLLALAASLAVGSTAGAAPDLISSLPEPLDPVHARFPVKLALPRLVLTGSALEPAVAPVEGGRVASGFGYRRARLRRRRQFHAGLDFNAERGAAVLAARRGIVLNVASDAERLHGFLGYGNAVVVYHPESDDFSFYAHLEEVLVEVGQGLAAGQKLGRVGNSNNGKFRGMYPHLHFEVRQRGRDGRAPFPGPYRDNAIDPLAWLVEHGMERP
ncbi:MAG: M23 family metallopeptidase [Sandaracinaceae bacterium]|nr:M23 family metallopeptidase [Sandaracinaceae bacterium]